MFTLKKSISSCLLLVIGSLVFGCFSASINRRKAKCNQIPPPVLSEILGPAYNSRYMSIEQPPLEVVDSPSATADSISSKRAPPPSSIPSFYVDDHFAADVSDLPAWKTSHHLTQQKHTIFKRAVKPARQWECESRIRWLDLGPDYFPRYLRSVECTSRTCWYDMMQCKPRSFTVKILRRKKDKCIEDEGLKIGQVGLPQDLRELWIWEERAVNFCCDCAM